MSRNGRFRNIVTRLTGTHHKAIESVNIKLANVDADFVKLKILCRAKGCFWQDDTPSTKGAGTFSDIYVHCVCSFEQPF